MHNHRHWVGTWTTAPAPAEGVAFSNHTVRMNVHASIGGDTLRVRLSNAYGTRKLLVGAARVGLRDTGPAIIKGSDRMLTFGGAESATIAAGTLLISDPVSLPLPPLGDLAISVYLPGDLPATFGITGRYSRQTNYISPPGNFASAVAMPVGKITDDWYFVCGVDVLASRETGGVVALGDSLTDANISTIDAFCRWPDQLSRRLQARAGGRSMTVMNQGLGGNRILHDIRGDSGLRRFDRDVLVQPGVTHAIVMLGTNDLRNRWAKPDEEVTAEQMIAGLKQLAVRAQTRGVGREEDGGADDLVGPAEAPQRDATRQLGDARLAGPLGITPVDPDHGAGRRHAARDLEPQPACRARDQHDAPGQREAFEPGGIWRPCH